MSLGQHATTGISQRNGERAAILESEHERRTNQVRDVLAWRKIDRPFDPMKTGDGESVSGREGLISRELVTHLSQHLTLAAQVAHTCAFLDKLHPQTLTGSSHTSGTIRTPLDILGAS